MFVAHVRCIRENGTPVEVQLQRPQLAMLMEDIVAFLKTLSDGYEGS